MDLASGVGERLAEGRVLLGLCELALATKDPCGAVKAGLQAAEAIRGINAPLYLTQVLTLLSDAYSALGDVAAAGEAMTEAANLRAKMTAEQM